MTKRRMTDSPLISLTCNLTGKTVYLYQDYYDSKVKQYGNEEKLKKFYIQSKIIKLIKRGYSLDSIANSLGFEFNHDKEEYYKELTKFHLYNNKFIPVKNRNEKISFLKTDPSVTDFIARFQSVVHVAQ